MLKFERSVISVVARRFRSQAVVKLENLSVSIVPRCSPEREVAEPFRARPLVSHVVAKLLLDLRLPRPCRGRTISISSCCNRCPSDLRSIRAGSRFFSTPRAKRVDALVRLELLPRSDHEPPALPWDIFFDGKRNVSKLLAKVFRSFFLRFRISP